MIHRQIIGGDTQVVMSVEDSLEENAIQEKAANHVDWLLGTLRPLLIDQFLHGFKHGIEHAACSKCRPEGGQQA